MDYDPRTTLPKTQRYTPELDHFIRNCCRNGWTARECAHLIGRTRNSVIARSGRLGIHFPHGPGRQHRRRQP